MYICRSIFPSGYNLVEKNKNLFLLHCYYYKNLDTLTVLYVDYTTGETIRKEIKHPKVPVFVSQRKLPKHQEFIHIQNSTRYMVSYNNKEEEMIKNLYQPKVIRYKDKFRHTWVEKYVYPKNIKGSVGLDPNVFLFDAPIEYIVYLEYTLSRYEQQGKYLYELVPIPDLHLGSFDIETHQNEDGEWNINTNTFVDGKTYDCYLDVVRHKEFNRCNELENNVEQWKQEVKDLFKSMIDSCTLSGQKKIAAQSIANDFLEKMKLHVTFFDNEASLIKKTTHRMFTEHKPQFLAAFNATYDVGMFLDRIKDLGLPLGTFNQQGIGYDDVPPPADTEYRSNSDDSRPFIGDDFNPTKRVVYLNNLSSSVIVDTQTVFFSNRSTQTFSNYKLQTVAENILGFGKVDYTHITPNILDLAKSDFWFHSKYAIIDSILLVLIDKVSKDLESKLIYCMSCKVNIEEAPRNNSSITRGIFTDCVIRGYIPGNNINKITSKISDEDLKTIGEQLGIDYLPKVKNAVANKENFGGGIVLKPGLYNYNFKDYGEIRNVLSNEALIENFRRIENAAYLDFKSHYPSQTLVRNLSKDTLLGNLHRIRRMDGTVLAEADRRVAGFNDTVKKHLGSVNIAALSRDPISFGNICCNLPSINDLVASKIPFDSDPIFNRIKEPIIELEKPKPFIHKFASILSSINTYNYKNHISNNKKKDSSNEMDNEIFNIDTSYFYFTNGDMTFNGSYVRYIYNNYDLYSALLNKEAESPQYGKIFKGIPIFDNNKLNKPKHNYHEINNEYWRMIDKDEWIDIFTWDETSKMSNIFGITTYINKYCFYFPWNAYMKQITTKINNSKIFISTPIFRLERLKETSWLEIEYTIMGENELKLTIRQLFQIINLDD